jgi:alpha-1,3-mannosyl-glycoprotein beta-1,2-N-acetylglucosaminyltransferase
LLLALAWSWIAAALVIVYHGMSESTNNGTDAEAQQHESPLLIFTCRRAEYLQQTLMDVLRYLPNDCHIGCPLIISQDGHDAEVATLIHKVQRSNPNIPILHYQHIPNTNLRKSPYQELAVHYGWALQKVFDEFPKAQRVLILEEDLHLAPDFFLYLERLAPLLDQDESLLAVSAFNDNGIEGQVKDASRVVRSDFFPGLGWILTRKLWREELSKKWPSGYWDDWLREPAQRKGRHVLRPEVRANGECRRVFWLFSRLLFVTILFSL